MILVERTQEHTVLANHLSECMRKKGSAILVTGEAGHGKTEILQHFMAYARTQGVLTLTATCSQLEKDIPLIAIGELLSSIDMRVEWADATKRFLKLRNERVQAWSARASATQAPIDIIEEFHRLLSKITERTPLLIGVDDVQYMDIPSLQCMFHFIRHMEDSRTVILMTESSKLPPAHPSFHTDFLRLRHCRRINLPPLSDRGAVEVVSHTVDTPLAPSIGAEYFQVTGGNPLLLHALLMDRQAAGRREFHSVVIGSHFKQALTRILHRIDPSLIRMAQGLALISEPGPPALLDRLLGTAPGSAGHVIQVLTDIGVVANGTFRHPAVGAALLDELSADERAAMHHHVARLLQVHGAPPSAVVHHLLAAGPVHAPWAVPILQEASEQALADDDRERAVRLLNLALQMCSDEQPGSSIRALLLDTTWGVDTSAARRHLSRLTVDLKDGPLPTREAFHLARHLVWNGQGSKTLDVVLRSLEERHSKGEPGAAVEADMVRSWISCVQPQLLVRRYPSSPPTPWEPTSDIRLRASMLLHSALSRGPDHVFIGDVEQVLRCTRIVTGEDCNVVVCALLSLVYTDRVGQALEWCNRFLQETAHGGRTEFAGLLRSVQAEALLRRGELQGAHRSALDSLLLLPRKCWGVAIGSPASTLVLASTAMGAYTSAREYLESEVLPETHHTRFGLQFLYSRGRYHLSVGEAEAALVDFISCGNLARAWGLDWPGFVPWRGGAAEAQFRLGNRQAANALAKEQLSLLGSDRARTWGLSLRVLADVAEPPERPRLFTEAAKVLHMCGDRAELANALAGLGRTHHLLGDSRQAQIVLRRAKEIADECGAAFGDATSADRTPAADAFPFEDTNADAIDILKLSDAERRVAALAARGHSNREISDQLFVTVSTVEQHLTRVYRKLGISGRHGLPSDLYFDGSIPF